MANLTTKLCGVELESPFILGSGPLSYSAEGLIEAAKAGAGAVVTKTIQKEAAVNPVPHMWRAGQNTLINSELWADYDAERWIQEEIPKAKAGGVKVLIANVGGPTDEAVALAKRAQCAGADILEVGCGYLDPGDFYTRVQAIRQEVSIPLLIKVNANWNNTPQIALQCIEAGANGITAIDSIGPALRINIRTGQSFLGGDNGYGWISGEAILPFTMRIVHDIAKHAQQDIVGLGGITRASDAIEMLMAGATACGICTAPILHGLQIFTKLNRELSNLMDSLGYASIQEISRKSLIAAIQPESYSPNKFKFDAEKCSYCRLCETVCCYNARTIVGKENIVDVSRCRACGLCFSVCPKGALYI